MPELILLSEGKPVLRCPLHGQSVSVGKSAANDISVPDESLPGLHCSFEPVPSNGPSGYRVVDRGGQSVFVGREGKRDEYEHKDLDDGDEIQLGHLVGKFNAVAEGGEVSAPSPKVERAQRTGILRTSAAGAETKLTRLDIRLKLPAIAGGGVREIPPEGLRFGANPDNDIVIDDGFVSSFHAQIFLKGERLFVRDLDSTNGTFVGAVRVVEAEVPMGSILKLGKAEIQVDTSESEEPIGAPAGEGPWKCCDLTTADAGFARTFAFIEKVAPHDATVCVFGETGSGKELVAQALHRLSGRRGGPLVPLNCAAVPQNLIESELFGHEKGAFTGADKQRVGAFEEANKGTIFLDEVGELASDVQAKLLRVLETRAVRRLGGRGDIAIDVRVVCATHRDLVQHVKEGKFREDLLHRLYVIPVKLPSLRERPVDIVHLARHFLTLLSPQKGVKLTEGAEKKLRNHPFPGNVRELRNVVQRALIMGDGKQVTEKDVVFIPVTLAEATMVGQVYKAGMTMDDIEREAYRGALKAYGSASEAARALGLPKTTFWRRGDGARPLEQREARVTTSNTTSTTKYTETIAPDEAARFDGFAAELRAMQKARTKDGSVMRGLHAKSHVNVVGTLVVPALPSHLAIGPFASAREWPVYARFSNGSPRKEHDSTPDVRGLALKIVGVPGKKIIPGLEDKKTQDFLFIPTPSIPFRTPDEFVSFVRISAQGGPPMLLVRLLGAFGLGRGLKVIQRLAKTPKVTSMVKTRLFTAVPHRFGDTAAKLALFPVPGPAATVPMGASASAGKHALREDLVHALKHGVVEFSLRAQLFVDERTTPIEDASVDWPEDKAPFIEIARLVFPKQDTASPKGKEIEELVETLSFDPWHSIEELRPVGAVMRARAHAYRDSVIERKAAPEPDDVIGL